jgi:diadenosine tetraphosphatase ApaH/serine/threonine PP2A family protein phosphatase
VAAGLTAHVQFCDGIFACHGRPQDDNAYLLENVEAGRLVPARYTQVAERVRAVGSRFILCAHSHIPGAAAAGDTMVINPGSVGLPAYEDPTPPAHVSESGSPLARYAMLHLDGEKASFEHIAIPYDHLSAARRAEESQNPAWAHFLATGYARDRGVSDQRARRRRGTGSRISGESERGCHRMVTGAEERTAAGGVGMLA